MARHTLLKISKRITFVGMALAAVVLAEGPKVETAENAKAAAGLPAPPSIGGCNVFPADNVWNTPIDKLPVDPNSDSYINTEGGAGSPLFPEFGTVYNGEPNGYAYIVVPSNQAQVPIVFTAYGAQSDPGPYPIPPNAPIDGGPNSTGDRHVLVLQSGTCKLYEMFKAYPQSDGSWQAASGALFNLTEDGPLRPAGWTSADAAGLPMLPGLARYDEVQQALASDGVLHHALRMTMAYTRNAYIWPARHAASTLTGTAYPPMGQRFRLKASVSTTVYPGTTTPVSPSNQVILRTLQKYGVFAADNGASFFISGAPDPSWNDGDLHNLTYYSAADFEAVDESSLQVNPNSGATTVGASATYLSIDATTLGNWTGKYGSNGQSIPNDLTSNPAYATVAFTNAHPYTWAAATTDSRALQTSSGSSSRIASTYYNASGFTIDVNLTDGNPHKISLYLCDWDGHGSRAETVTIVDANTQAVLSTQNFSSFQGGIYADWNIQGHVQINVLKTTGSNAVVNGIFFDPPGTSASVSFVGADATTVGNWSGKYGADGQLIPNDLINAPSYSYVSLANDLLYTWAASSSDPRALQKASASASRIASAYYNASSFKVNLNLTDGNTHKVSIYLCDWDNSKRMETITIVDATTQAVLYNQSFSSFYGGIYETWDIKGNVQIQVVRTGGSNAVVNGIFFDPPA